MTLADKNGQRPLQGIMLSPVTPHDAPKELANQLIIMGRFSLAHDTQALRFYNGLYGNQPDEQMLEMTAIRKSAKQKHVFELSPKSSASTLFEK